MDRKFDVQPRLIEAARLVRLARGQLRIWRRTHAESVAYGRALQCLTSALEQLKRMEADNG